MPISVSTSKISLTSSEKLEESSFDCGLDFSLFERFATEFGTPFYAYDADRLALQSETLRALLPVEANSSILYSFKSNPNPIVAGELRKQKCRADLTSPGEIDAAKLAGFNLGEALYGGPGKSVNELIGAILVGIRHFSIESIHDLAALRDAAESTDTPVKALLRINPDEAPKAKLAMSGVASQFGFEEVDLRSEGRKIIAEKGEVVSVVGIHIYWGTQIGDADALLACFERTVQIAEEISALLDFPLEILNLGGGFPWPYSTRGEGADISDIRDGLIALHADAGSAKNADWWFESGRFLSASSGTLVSK